MNSVERVAAGAAAGAACTTSWPSAAQQLARLVHAAHALRVDARRRAALSAVIATRRRPGSRRTDGRVRLGRARRPASRRRPRSRRARRAAAAVSATVRVSTPSQARNESPRSGPRETRPRCGLRPDQPAARGRDADRAAAVVAVRDRQHAGGDRGRRAARGAARRARRGSTGCAWRRCGAARWSAGSRTRACSSCPTTTKPASRRRRTRYAL